MSTILVIPTADGVVLAADDRLKYDRCGIYQDGVDKTFIAGNLLTVYSCAGQGRVWWWESDDFQPYLQWYQDNQPHWNAFAEIGRFLAENENFILSQDDDRLDRHLVTCLNGVEVISPYAIEFHIVLAQHSNGISKVRHSKFKKTKNSVTHTYYTRYYEFHDDANECVEPREIFLAGDYLEELRINGLGQAYLAFRDLPVARRRLTEALPAIEAMIADTSAITQQENIPIGPRAYFKVISENVRIV